MILQQKGCDVHHVGPDATVLDALRALADHNCGALVVLDRDRAVGMLSERDYARKVALLGKESKHTLVREIMDDAILVPPDLGVEQCMQMMTERRTRHLVVNDQNRVAGVVSIGDVVKALIDDQQFMIAQLEKYITGV
jgi:CBS domain-containing protein